MTYSRANADEWGKFEMKHIRTVLAVTVFGVFAAQGALASCKAPESPSAIPDGRTARMEAMLEARRNVETYVRKVSDYTKCEGDALKLQDAKARQTEILNRFNAAVREFKVAIDPVKTVSYR